MNSDKYNREILRADGLDDENMLDALAIGRKNAFTNIPIARQHSFYLTGEILGPEHYTEWFHTIRHSSEADVIFIHINSPGGDLATAVQFMRVLDETEAMIVCSVEGNCMSAATLIFLRADKFSISDYSTFMFHNYSSIMGGKGGELHDRIVHDKDWSEKILRGSYTDFLTEAEIQSILDNKDIWLTGPDVGARLENKLNKMEKKAKKEAKKLAKKAAKKERKASEKVLAEEVAEAAAPKKVKKVRESVPEPKNKGQHLEEGVKPAKKKAKKPQAEE